jgi:hypothetical protein
LTSFREIIRKIENTFLGEGSSVAICAAAFSEVWSQLCTSLNELCCHAASMVASFVQLLVQAGLSRLRIQYVFLERTSNDLTAS